MLSLLTIYHKEKASVPTELPPYLEGQFCTCMRQIYLCWSDKADQAWADKNGFEIYTEFDAYEFVLTVICGLKSPVIGETEVLGQFKRFVESEKLVESPLRFVFDMLLMDVKKVRRKHLLNLGSQSYGSYLRKSIPPETPVVLIGSGALCLEVLPWLQKDSRQLQVLARNKKALAFIKQSFKNIEVGSLDSVGSMQGKVVIVLAPVDTHWLETNLMSAERIFDLRGEGRENPINLEQALCLDQVFSHIEENSRLAKKCQILALREVAELTKERTLSERVRPNGWEDIISFGDSITN